MSDDSDNSSIINECELFVVESESFERTFQDDHPENSAPKSLIFNAGSPVNRAESLEQLREYVMSLENTGEEKKEGATRMKQGCFMGFLTKVQVEKKVRIPGQFATYYLIDELFDSLKPPKDSNISLNLFVCYLNTCHRYHHYPIVKKLESDSSRIFFQLAHFDYTKPANEPIFTSIKRLLKHYTQFVYVDSITETGGLGVEVFPK
ncbi:hypothetical protein CRE_29668 [Caenorhabditis remanei]|uniref:Uncharacterized protein n=1 Tax=Caenorhabditis remanei TaxID=31234 RepID=E3LV40_CAERE|nr:hypothetical protein CRE_29668 [Caenorhabditis remanei]